MKQTGYSDMLKKNLQECLYVNHCGISWPLVSYSINSFSYNSRQQKRTLMIWNQQMKEISSWNTSLI